MRKLASASAIGCALLVVPAAFAQSVQPSTDKPVQPPATQSAQPPADSSAQSATPNTVPQQPASNPWVIVPEGSADRCLAEAVGTAENPKTGAPERVIVDHETGKRLCPPAPPKERKPPR